jgi:DNA-binding transcriptional ArsR family regulator
MFRELDPLLHSQLRLAIISLLSGLEEAEFNFLKEKTGATSGNLSVQIEKLRKAEYIDVKKQFRKNYPLTICSITEKGREAFTHYIEDLKSYLDPKKMAG